MLVVRYFVAIVPGARGSDRQVGVDVVIRVTKSPAGPGRTLAQPPDRHQSTVRSQLGSARRSATMIKLLLPRRGKTSGRATVVVGASSDGGMNVGGELGATETRPLRHKNDKPSCSDDSVAIEPQTEGRGKKVIHLCDDNSRDRWSALKIEDGDTAVGG